MEFEIIKATEILSRTPHILRTLLRGLSDEWIHNNEGENTWSAFDVLGHLIICEKTNFMHRAAIILSGADTPFAPIDMLAQFKRNKGKNSTDLLSEFEQARSSAVEKLIGLKLSGTDLQKTGQHLKLGKVTLSQLLATWVAHDLVHLAQISRVMAKQYQQATGPFIEFLRIPR